jgi:hypothetical protein
MVKTKFGGKNIDRHPRREQCDPFRVRNIEEEASK